MPELVVAMLACARIGAVHTTMKPDTGPSAVSDLRLVITADGAHRRGGTVPYKAALDPALARSHRIGQVLVVRRTAEPVPWRNGRDLWWHEETARHSERNTSALRDGREPLFAPAAGGPYATQDLPVRTARSLRAVLGLRPDDVYWCTADPGSAAGVHAMYAALACGAALVLHEGAPVTPEVDGLSETARRYGVTVLHTAPAAIRGLTGPHEGLHGRGEFTTLRVVAALAEPDAEHLWSWHRRPGAVSGRNVRDDWELRCHTAGTEPTAGGSS
ncbi:AMP-binding protein [Kitasatospora sp. NPDC048296]|uniref:AMP-binding protein n=1 Tax=Kitasatospora sp. NPDC048296 TaxID=3364048 RepID=UPI003713F94A